MRGLSGAVRLRLLNSLPPMSELNPKRLLKGATPRLIEEGAASLKSMVAKIDTTKMNNPSFLTVLTGTGDYAYCRQDGVYVVPIGCLKD